MQQPPPIPARRRRRLRSVALVGTLAAVLAAPSSAQAVFDGPAYAFPVPDYVSGLIGASTLQNTYDATSGGGGSGTGRGGRDTSRRAAPRRPKPPTAAQRATLRFRADPAVTAKIHDVVVERSGQDPATIVPEFERVTTEWRQVLSRRVGWRPRDLGDAAAFSFVQGYRLVHGVTTFDERGLARLRAAVRDNLAANPQIRRLSDARKQEAAESLELRVIFFGGNLAGLVERGDGDGVAEQTHELTGWLRETFGVDVTKVKLTRRGLVKR